VLTYPQALGRFLAGTDVSGVAGTHGKTTTTAMIAAAAEEAGLPVSYLVAAPMQGGRDNVRYVPGSPFVVEADEYRGAFLEYAGQLAQLVITNVDFDRPDYYLSQDAVEKAFGELLAHTPPGAAVFACGDSAGVRAVARADDRMTSYGFGAQNAVRVELTGASDAGSVFTVTGPGGGGVRLRAGGIQPQRGAAVGRVQGEDGVPVAVLDPPRAPGGLDVRDAVVGVRAAADGDDRAGGASGCERGRAVGVCYCQVQPGGERGEGIGGWAAGAEVIAVVVVHDGPEDADMAGQVQEGVHVLVCLRDQEPAGAGQVVAPGKLGQRAPR
jgi:hypothetical protein